jgi:chromosome segregation ATPase
MTLNSEDESLMQPTVNPEAEVAQDRLWKYQLRREHATLLNAMENQRNAFTAFAEEAKAAQERLQEQINGLRSKFDKLAEHNEKHAQEIKDYLEDMQEKTAEVEKLKAELKVVGARVNAAAGIENSAVDSKLHTISQPILLSVLLRKQLFWSQLRLLPRLIQKYLQDLPRRPPRVENLLAQLQAPT